MQQPLKNQSPQGLEGLEDLFVSDGQTDTSVQTLTNLFEASVPEAARLLGITERSIWRRIRQGKLQSKLVNGKTLVSICQPDVSPTRQTDDHDASVLVSVDQTDTSINHMQSLLDIIKEKDEQLQAASFRNGYLEAQIQNHKEQIKLLTDSQFKPGLWDRFKEFVFNRS